MKTYLKKLLVFAPLLTVGVICINSNVDILYIRFPLVLFYAMSIREIADKLYE